jgi:hypothetical protein
MAFEIFSIVIAIAICRVPLVAVHIAFVEVGTTPGFCSVIIEVAVAALNSGSVTVLETGGRAIAAAETPGAAIATAFNAAGRTIAAAAAPVAASASIAASRGPAPASAATRATAAGPAPAAATLATAATGAGTTAATLATAAAPTPASAASAAVADEIDKVGAGVSRGLEVQHWRRVGDRSAQHDGPGESRHRFPIDTHCDLHRIWSTRQALPARRRALLNSCEGNVLSRGLFLQRQDVARERQKHRARTRATDAALAVAKAAIAQLLSEEFDQLR